MQHSTAKHISNVHSNIFSESTATATATAISSSWWDGIFVLYFTTVHGTEPHGADELRLSFSLLLLLRVFISRGKGREGNEGSKVNIPLFFNIFQGNKIKVKFTTATATKGRREGGGEGRKCRHVVVHSTAEYATATAMRGAVVASRG